MEDVTISDILSSNDSLMAWKSERQQDPVCLADPNHEFSKLLDWEHTEDLIGDGPSQCEKGPW